MFKVFERRTDEHLIAFLHHVPPFYIQIRTTARPGRSRRRKEEKGKALKRGAERGPERIGVVVDAGRSSRGSGLNQEATAAITCIVHFMITEQPERLAVRATNAADGVVPIRLSGASVYRKHITGYINRRLNVQPEGDWEKVGRNDQ
jgi:hypothetical protein